MSDWRRTRHVWLPFIGAILVQGLAMFAFWSLWLYSDIKGTRPPLLVALALFFVGLVGMAGMIRFGSAALKDSGATRARSIFYIGIGLLLAAAAFTFILLLSRGY